MELFYLLNQKTMDKETPTTEEELTPEQQEMLDNIIEQSEVQNIKHPITRPSSCDVYRNNKEYLKRLALLHANDLDDKVREAFEATTIEEADAKFMEHNSKLPFHWFSKLQNIYYTFRDAFIINQ